MKVVNGDKELGGATMCIVRSIRVADSPRASKFIESVLHELYHALACDDNGWPHDTSYNNISPAGNGEHDHDGVYFAARVWSDFLMANPEFIDWLKKMERRVESERREDEEREKALWRMRTQQARTSH